MRNFTAAESLNFPSQKTWTIANSRSLIPTSLTSTISSLQPSGIRPVVSRNRSVGRTVSTAHTTDVEQAARFVLLWISDTLISLDHPRGPLSPLNVTGYDY
jgi:hypothetical protein